jgi:mono/diheme cytochrome c family protein
VTRLLAFVLAACVSAPAATLAMDSARGEKLFDTLACVECHGVNGKGSRIAPDLGRLMDRNFTPAALSSTMWNHAPAMWTAMGERRIRSGDLDEQAAGDLFAYFYSARFFEKPGDAARGKRVFNERGCAGCHALNPPSDADVARALVPAVSRLVSTPVPGAPPVAQWDALADPVSLAEAMWNHAPRMLAAAGAKHRAWPSLSGQDLTDLLVYLRNLPATRQRPVSFQTSSGSNGEALFQSKGCAGCHRSGTALGRKIKGQTLTEIAAAMWDHAPRMSAAMKSPPPQFNSGEMRDLLSYLWARQFFENSGDAARGKRVFTAKRCSACHGQASSGAPDLTASPRVFNGATMVAALWRHGPRMLEQMKSKSIPWPRFESRQMSDLIAYLNSGEKGK